MTVVIGVCRTEVAIHTGSAMAPSRRSDRRREHCCTMSGMVEWPSWSLCQCTGNASSGEWRCGSGIVSRYLLVVGMTVWWLSTWQSGLAIVVIIALVVAVERCTLAAVCKAPRLLLQRK